MLLPEREGGHLAFVFALAWMMVAANVLATALSWSASGLLIKVTRVRSALLVPILLLLVFVGAFTERNLVENLLATVIIGAVGLAFAHFRWPRAPLLIGLVLGPLAENRLFLSIDAYGRAGCGVPGCCSLVPSSLPVFYTR
jgi:TctA family transporter